MTVLEAVRNPRVRVDKVLVATSAHGPSVDDILAAAAERGIRVQRVSPERVTRVSRNGRHDQGVAADLEAPERQDLPDWLNGAGATQPTSALVLDGVNNPANVGLAIRAAIGAGLDAVVLPRAGSPDLGPLVLKASAGVALSAPVVRVPTAGEAVDALQRAGWDVIGLRAHDGEPLWDAAWGSQRAFVLGNETSGVSEETAARLRRWVSIPLAPGIDSINVATAAAVLGYELSRRASTETAS